MAEMTQAEMAQAETRKLAAIMFTDMVGFSRQVGADERRALQVLDTHNAVIQQAVATYHGHILRFIGDAFLVEFPSVVNAVQCAQAIQAQFRAHNADQANNEQIHVRIGLHMGDIIQRDSDVFGDGANIAARLQELAEPDTICISQKVYQEVEKKIALGTVVSLGKPTLKNIAQRFLVYALLSESPKGLRQTLRVQRLKLKPWRHTVQVIATVFVFVLGSVGAIVLRDRYFSSLSSLPLPDKPSIAVLPFVNMSGDPEQEYFSDGLTEDLTTDLSRLSGLFVIARNSAFTYKGKAVKVEEVSRELGVRYVLEGSVQKAHQRVRINTQLVDATTGHHVWTERYDREMKDLFALQDEIVQRIVTTLKLQLAVREQGVLVQKTTDSLEAYDYYLRGLEYSWRFTKEANMQARQMYEKAIELDPQYAAAYASLGSTYWAEWIFQWNLDPRNLERASVLAQKAMALDDALPQAHQSLGLTYLYKQQHEQAKAEFEQAIALDPNFANAYVQLGSTLLCCTGRPEEGVGLIEKGIRLSPRQPPAIHLNLLGLAYIALGRYEEAIATLKQALNRDPNLLFAHVNLAVAYSELDREEEARAEAETVVRLNPNFSLEGIKQTYAVKDPAVLERYLAALRKAGLK